LGCWSGIGRRVARLRKPGGRLALRAGTVSFRMEADPKIRRTLLGTSDGTSFLPRRTRPALAIAEPNRRKARDVITHILVDSRNSNHLSPGTWTLYFRRRAAYTDTMTPDELAQLLATKETVSRFRNLATIQKFSSPGARFSDRRFIVRRMTAVPGTHLFRESTTPAQP